MRRSSNENDISYSVWKAEIVEGKFHRIFLDGVEQRSVETADEEAGTIVRCILDDEGHCQIDPNKPDEVWLEQLTGKVEIRIEDAA